MHFRRPLPSFLLAVYTSSRRSITASRWPHLARSSSPIAATKFGGETNGSRNPGGPGDDPEDPSLRAFLDWGQRRAVVFDCTGGGSGDNADETTDDEAHLRAIADAVRRSSPDLVVISEACHNCAEMMMLHHRIVRRSVEECGFNTVVTESGLPESRGIHDYVLGEDEYAMGTDGVMESSSSSEEEGIGRGSEEMWTGGLNKMYSAWEEGRELIRWMRERNRRFLREGKGGSGEGGGRNDDRLLRYYGSDIGGFYSDWRPPISKISRYLREVDPLFEEHWVMRMGPLIEAMGTSARVNFQKELTMEQQAEIATHLTELVDHLDANESHL